MTTNPEEQAVSMRQLQTRLFLAGYTSRPDADEAELRQALARIPNVTSYRVLHPIVLNDGVWAALHVLGDVELKP